MFSRVLCMTLPSASNTAWLVKFSEGIKLMKCFCLRFSYDWVSRFTSQTVKLVPSHLLHNVINRGIRLLKVGGEQLVLRVL